MMTMVRTLVGSRPTARRGYLPSGLPFNRFGRGPRLLVVLPGLQWEHRPQSALAARFLVGAYRFLGTSHTGWFIGRRPDLAPGTTMSQLAADYATVIRDDLGGPADVIGVSTGGSIALHLAAEHPDVVHRLVIHSAAHALTEEARRIQRRAGQDAARGDWVAVFRALAETVLPPSRAGRALASVMARLMAIGAPGDPGDFIAEVEAEDAHAFRDRLGEIRAPTLVVGGDRDPFYSPALLRETASGLPSGRLVLYEGMGHPAHGARFRRDVAAFLGDDLPNGVGEVTTCLPPPDEGPLGRLGPAILALSGAGFPLTQVAIARFGRRGALLVQAVVMGLLLRDLGLIASGAPSRLQPGAAVLLWAEAAAAAAAATAGALLLRDPEVATARQAGWAVPRGELFRRVAIGTLFGLHTVRFRT
jgi:pimeloyl-ACP methyl ester carboxylesterase